MTCSWVLAGTYAVDTVSWVRHLDQESVNGLTGWLLFWKLTKLTAITRIVIRLSSVCNYFRVHGMPGAKVKKTEERRNYM